MRTHLSIAVIGDSGVGKTSLLTQFIFSKFNPHYSSTIEDLYHTSLPLNDQTYTLDIVDTPGLDEF